MLKQAIKALPGVQSLRRWDYERRFAGDLLGAFRGVFESFDDARRSAPGNKPIGFDVPAHADLLAARRTRIFSYDYPVLFWLKPLLAPQLSIFDLGGHVGVHYYAYRKYLEYPNGLRWRVCEMPAVIEAGEMLRRTETAPGLSFTTEFRDADGADVMLAAGVVQYVERALPAQLAELARPPRHIFLGKLPLHDGPGFVTLQNGGPCFVPCHVFDRKQFLASFAEVGYELVDSWDDPSLSCRIPFHEDRAVRSYSGLYLRRR
jgi:putative methyltransferase (TIGR04325 family)